MVNDHIWHWASGVLSLLSSRLVMLMNCLVLCVVWCGVNLFQSFFLFFSQCGVSGVSGHSGYWVGDLWISRGCNARRRCLHYLPTLPSGFQGTSQAGQGSYEVRRPRYVALATPPGFKWDWIVRSIQRRFRRGAKLLLL